MFLKNKWPRGLIKKTALAGSLLFLAVVIAHDDGIPSSLTTEQRSRVIQWCEETDQLLEEFNLSLQDFCQYPENESEILLTLIEKTNRVNESIKVAWTDPTFSYIDEELKAHFGAVLEELREVETRLDSLTEAIAKRVDSGDYDQNNYDAWDKSLTHLHSNEPDHCHLNPCFLCRSKAFLWNRMGLKVEACSLAICGRRFGPKHRLFCPACCRSFESMARRDSQ